MLVLLLIGLLLLVVLLMLLVLRLLVLLILLLVLLLLVRLVLLLPLRRLPLGPTVAILRIAPRTHAPPSCTKLSKVQPRVRNTIITAGAACSNELTPSCARPRAEQSVGLTAQGELVRMRAYAAILVARSMAEQRVVLTAQSEELVRVTAPRTRMAAAAIPASARTPAARPPRSRGSAEQAAGVAGEGGRGGRGRSMAQAQRLSSLARARRLGQRSPQVRGRGAKRSIEAERAVVPRVQGRARERARGGGEVLVESRDRRLDPPHRPRRALVSSALRSRGLGLARAHVQTEEPVHCPLALN
jgi:hypothetical protein